uniref:Cytochrome c oxidase subunit 3 n=1 Tax=Gyrodactylus gurleyi TaxID=83195 RepID=A0A1C7A7I7_9PLAT|nr:cytochrome c oxidase subunit III [Gyrodactylus gurleyi]AMZ79738.1 cytochrome c oxidase subunit III [Gyrodactylus gurleyi]
MNWVSLYGSVIFSFMLIGLILWIPMLVLGGLIMTFLGVLWFLKDSFIQNSHYLNGFFLFIMSEVLIFASLFVTCLWFRDINDINISEYNELPLLGSFLLLGSSVTATCYHLQMNLSNIQLLLTIFLGICFIILQGFEYDESVVNLFSSVYHASCFTTISLHFSHVLIGLFLLIGLLVYTPKVVKLYYSNLVIWYWHFVDYIWLLVYSVVYIF